MAGLMEYKCPNCGGSIQWNAVGQQLKCPYCDTEFDIETLQGYDEILGADGKDDFSWGATPAGFFADGETDGLAVYSCNSCGGEIVGADNMGATSCPFCGNPVVIAGAWKGDLKPDYVIPFSLDKEAAKRKFSEHLSDKKFLPKAFKDENHIDEIKGLYVPFWLFDAHADGHFRYKAVRVRTYTEGNYDCEEKSYFSVTRGGNMDFAHVPVDGSKSMADDLMESIEPFDFSKAVDFKTAYLSGFLADKYDVDEKECISRANERITNSTDTALRETIIGYTSVVKESGNVSLSNSKASYALYPAWVLTTSWEGNNYIFAMNGQTGKFVGNLPVDNGAVWRYFLLRALLFGGGFFAIFMVIWNFLL